ncbi:MAG: redoxin domain-containing protein [Candidatus Zixiibacteriota bacterium]|nr:MAG: redoxin domain-containing protein [candidate division Zixibacteria bacterium]
MDNVNVIRNGFFAPDFTLSSTDGRMVSLKDCVSDNFLALCFFSNCESNRTKTLLTELDKGLPGTLYDFEMTVAAVTPEKTHRLISLKNELGLSFPLLSDTRMEVCGSYNVIDSASKIPAVHFSIFIIDNELIVHHRFIESPENEFRIEDFKKEISAII